MVHQSLERKWWSASLIFLFFLWGSAYFVRFAVDFLRSTNSLRPTVAAVFLASAAAVGLYLKRRKPRPQEWGVLLAALVVYGAAFFWMDRPEERVHLIQYSILAGLIWSALRCRWSEGATRSWQRPGPWAIVLNGLAGWSDEGVQAILPNRVYDLRDVGFNALAGLLAILFLSLLTRIRERT